MTDAPDHPYIPTLYVARISPHAKLPEKAHFGDLGYDLFAAESKSINPGKTVLVSTGIRIAFPLGFGAKIFDRSSVATKINVFVVAGVIDEGYRGEIKIALYNAGTHMHNVFPNDKIAQMVLLPVVNFPVVESDEVSIKSTTRGEGGFG